MKDVPYMNDLKNIVRKMAEFYENFPVFKCQHATRLVHKIIGLDELAGSYIPLDDWDAWNYDKERNLYVNIAFGQYDKNRPILITSDKSYPLIEIPRRTKKQRMTPDSSFEYIDEIVEIVKGER